jgi:mono/diheme cytochrome c family protein
MQADRGNAIPWPLSLRWPLALWRKAFAPAASAPAFDAQRFKDPVLARGAYLVEGPGHCGTCHTPRGGALQEKALDERSDQYLAGGQVIDGWVAVNLRGDHDAGLGAWSEADIEATLTSARNTQQAVIGEAMRDVVVHSTQHLTQGDVHAMAVFLKTLAPTAAPRPRIAAAGVTAGARGAELYVDNCAACHRSNGRGADHAFPKLADNATVLADDANSLIRLLLAGSSLPGTQAAPSPLGMPGFGARLSNAEIAALLTFVRSAWGNQAPPVTAHEVGRVRATLDAQRTAHAEPAVNQPNRPVM